MSLVTDYIKELGGYQVAKERSTPWLLNHGENWRNVKDATLLEYRRQHNIFEEKDNIVFVDEFMHGELMTVAWVRNGEVWMDDGAKRCTDLTMIRHATDAEIKAGKRLEVV